MEKEIFKDIIGYEGKYQISNLGRVKGLSRQVYNNFDPYMTKERILKSCINNAGYYVLNLCLNGKVNMHLVHRLIAVNFIPNPKNKPAINHKNGIKTDNRLDNIEWSTYSDNNQHAYNTGLKKRGEHHVNSKLTEVQVCEIREKLKNGESNILIANFYNVGNCTISEIKHNKRWKHIVV